MTIPAPDFRKLCAELVDELEDWIAYGNEANCADAHAVVDRARAALATTPPEPPTESDVTDLSPAAQAVLDAAFSVYDCEALYSLTEEQHASMIVVAALRAVADQVVPVNGSRKNNEIRAELLAIATELEGP